MQKWTILGRLNIFHVKKCSTDLMLKCYNVSLVLAEQKKRSRNHNMHWWCILGLGWLNTKICSRDLIIMHVDGNFRICVGWPKIVVQPTYRFFKGPNFNVCRRGSDQRGAYNFADRDSGPPLTDHGPPLAALRARSILKTFFLSENNFNMHFLP